MVKVMMVVLIQTWAAGAGASLSIPDMVAAPEGGLLSAPVRLEVKPGHQVAGLQFDLEYDPSVFELESEASVQAGAAAVAAEKQATYSSLGPGKIRVIVFGLNQTLLEDGEIASVHFTLNRERARAVEPLKLSNAILSDLSGTRVREESKDGRVQFSSHLPLEDSPQTVDAAFPAGLVVLAGFALALSAAFILWRYRSRPKVPH